MITLTFRSNETGAGGASFNFCTVKTISAAWNKLREFKNTIPAEQLEYSFVIIDLPEGMKYDRIPHQIIFLRNKKGKMEIKDFEKVTMRRMAKGVEDAILPSKKKEK